MCIREYDELCPAKVLTEVADQFQRGFGLPVKGDMTDDKFGNRLGLHCGQQSGDILRFADQRYAAVPEHVPEAIQKKAPLA